MYDMAPQRKPDSTKSGSTAAAAALLASRETEMLSFEAGEHEHKHDTVGDELLLLGGGSSHRSCSEGSSRTEMGTARRLGLCRENFAPGESFQSWESYGRALKETGTRLRDRVLARAEAEDEIGEVRERSRHDMKKELTWWDLIWFGVGAVVGSGIFVLTGVETHSEAGPAVILSFVISGISALLAVFCYTEFAVEIPCAGGSFAYLKVELGDFVAFLAAGNLIMECLIGGGAVARAWTSYLATLCNRSANDFRIHTNLPEGYNELDPIAVGILILTCIIAVVSTKATSRVNYIASVIHIAIIAFVVVAGLTKADTKNYSDFAPFGVKGIFHAASVLFFAYLGFDAVATMAEETRNPGRDIPLGLVGSMTLVITLYCLMAITLCLMQDYRNIDINAPFSVAFDKTGLHWAKYIVALGALKGMTTVLMVGVVGQARYMTHIARSHFIPPCVAFVNKRTGTPVAATVIMVVPTAVIALFTDLELLANLTSISVLFVFVLVALALLVRRYYVPGVTSRRDQAKLVLFLVLILATSVATAAYWALSNDGWVGYTVTLPALMASTLGLQLCVPQARFPKVWGVPMVPWVPVLSIAMNCFLLASLDGASFVRFGGWTVIMLVYYVLFGLHASYDAARAARKMAAAGAGASVGGHIQL